MSYDKGRNYAIGLSEYINKLFLEDTKIRPVKYKYPTPDEPISIPIHYTKVK